MNTENINTQAPGLSTDPPLRASPLVQPRVNLAAMAISRPPEKAINNLRDTALWGGLFAILILLFFLRDLRMTSIMMLSIPLSVLAGLVR